MKAHVTASLALAFLLVVFIPFGTFAQEADPYEDLLDQYVVRCRSKIEMRSSALTNVRRSASVAMLKGTFAGAYREALVQGMLRDAIAPKPYKVDLYVNQHFFDLVRSRKSASLNTLLMRQTVAVD